MSPDPFLGAADLFETEWVPRRPGSRESARGPRATWAGHYDGYHVLNVSKRAHTSAMMARARRPRAVAHGPLRGGARLSRPVDRGGAVPRALRRDGGAPQARAHCYQIANHMKDIYADDITLSVAPADKLLGFLESTLAAAVVADRPEVSRDGAPAGRRPARTQRSPRSTPHSRSPSSSATTSPARTTVSTTSRVRPAATPTPPSTSTRSRSGSSRSAPTPPRATTGRRSSRPPARTRFKSQNALRAGFGSCR